MINSILDTFFDKRTPEEKREDAEVVQSIKAMHARGETIIIGPRGGMRLVKRVVDDKIS